MATLGKHRPELPVGVPVDTRQLISLSEEERLARLDAAIRELTMLRRRLPAVFYMMREAMAGQPRAAATQREGDDPGGDRERARLWCSTHERSLSGCDAADLSCQVEQPRQVSDPVGEAATSFDRASKDAEALRRRVDVIVGATIALHELAAAYPTDIVVREELDPEDEVGVSFCRCCWKDNKTLQEVTLRRNGQPYYRGLCRWCGDMARDLGGDPPTWLVEKHHRGERILVGDRDRARRELGPTRKRKKK